MIGERLCTCKDQGEAKSLQSNRFSLAMTLCREWASAYQATPTVPEQMNPGKKEINRDRYKKRNFTCIFRSIIISISLPLQK